MGNFPDFVASVRLSGSVPSPFQVSNDHGWPSLPRSCKNSHKTRKHSSRMHTPCSSPETPLDRDAPPCEQSNTCENSTLPQTLFAGGKDGYPRLLRFLDPLPISFLDPLISQVKRNRLHVDVHKINNSLCSGILQSDFE